MNVYALIPLLSVVAYAILFAFALRHQRRSERRAFTLYLAAAGFWSFISFLLHLENSILQQYTVVGTKVIILAAVWMTLTYYLFLRTFVQKPVGREIYLGSAFVLLVSLLAALGIVPRDAYAADGVLYIDHGPALYLYILFSASLAGTAAFFLIQHYREASTSQARSRITYLLIGMGMVTLGSLTNLSDFLEKYPIDHVGNLSNAIIISYAILKHQLLDIRVVIRKGLAYSILTIGITSVYLLTLFGAQALFHWSGYSNLVLAAGVALAAAAAFNPLRNLTQERVDRLFFRDTYEYRRMLTGFRRNVNNALDLERLASDILDPLVQTLRAEWAALLLPDVDSNDYRARFASRNRAQGTSLQLRFRRDSPLLSLLAREQRVIPQDFLDTFPEGLALTEFERGALRSHGVKVLCPMMSRGGLTGILLLGEKRSGHQYNDEELELLLTVASGAALALDNARILDTLRQQQRRADELLAQVVAAQEQERERVAADLHDGVAQWLVRASYQAQICKALLGQHNGADVDAELTAVESTVDESLKELRRVLAGLRPPTLDELGLTHSLRQAVEGLQADGVNSHFETQGTAVRLQPSVEIAAYRIVQEALNNVRKHAEATQVTLRVDFWAENMRIEVIDNGKGFDISKTLESAIAQQHMGLLGMKRRVEWLGGAFKLESNEDVGTTVTVRLPVDSAA